jgi:sialate O-acetylesterase
VIRSSLSLGFCFIASLAAAAELDPWFGDGMVLQREQPIRIIGKAQPNSQVTVRLGEQTALAKTDGTGRWEQTFTPRTANSQPTTLTVQEAGRPDVSVRDILMGDVWVCAGQSNMEFPLSRDAEAKQELANANLPLIRLRNYSFAGQYRSAAPLDATTVARMTVANFYAGRWEPCTPKAAAPMSAVGYYFAKRVAADTGVPIALVNYAVGGAPIEAFISREALARSAVFRKKVTGNWLSNESIEGSFVRLRAQQHLGTAKDVPSDDCGPNHGFKPGFAWAAGPAQATHFAIKGVLWYQGESNAIRQEDIAEYGVLMKLLVADWRRHWHQADLPFYWVQLPSINEPARQFWPEFREVQRQLTTEITSSGMAVALDVGTPKDVHPRNKRPVGERLAALALRDLYGRKDLIAEGPVAIDARQAGKTIRVRFRSADGLTLVGPPTPLVETRQKGAADFKAARETRVEGNELVVETDGLIVEIRYAWHMNAAAALRNGAGLPAGPFALKVSE